MSKVLVEVAEAVRVELEGLTLSQKFTLARSYGDWEDLLDDLETSLRIDVVPNSCLVEMISRGTHRYNCNVSILLRKRIGIEERKGGRIDNAIIDQLTEDLQTVHEYFAPSQPNQTGRRLTSIPQAAWLPESDIKAPYSRKLLRDHGQYSGWCVVVYGYPRAFGA